jgi:hypothetical protein
MASPHLWMEVLSWVKALFEAGALSADLTKLYLKYRNDPATVKEAQRVSVAFSTFSDAEVESLLSRLKGCRDRFIAQGGGSERARCICSVLHEAAEANGGALPAIDDWENIYRQLRCGNSH